MGETWTPLGMPSAVRLPHNGGMRAVSLVPSGTLMLRALGVEPVGVSHSCPNPHGVPVVTEGLIPKGLPQGEIDRRVREAYQRGLPLYRIRGEILASLEPELLVTQGVCEVCAVTPGEVAGALPLLAQRPKVVELTGVRLGDLFADLRHLAREAGVEERGRRLEEELRNQLACLPPPPKVRPRVVFLEWLDPPYLGGHWVPEMVALAGGEYLGPAPGEASRRVPPETLPEAEVVLLSFCGYSLEEAEQAVTSYLDAGGPLASYLEERRTYILDAAPFQALTHRVVEGIHLLAGILRGEAAPGDLVKPL